MTLYTIRTIELLREFIEHNPDPCSYDHHGYCQEHGGDAPCHVERATELLSDWPKFQNVTSLLGFVRDRMPNVQWSQDSYNDTIILYTNLMYIDNASEPGPKIAGLYDRDYAGEQGWL